MQRDCARAASVVVSIHCTNRDWCIVEVCKDTRRIRIASGSIEARSTEAVSAASWASSVVLTRRCR